MGVCHPDSGMRNYPHLRKVHPFQKVHAACLAFLGLVLGFGEGDLLHGGNLYEAHPIEQTDGADF